MLLGVIEYEMHCNILNDRTHMTISDNYLNIASEML